MRGSKSRYASSETKSRWSHSGMSGSMKKRHTQERIPGTRRGVASRMSLRHLPTNAGQGRPAEHQRCCGRQPQHCLRCVRSHPMDGAPRLGSRRVRRLPAPAYRLLFFSARAGPNPWACSFLFGPWSSAKRMTVSSFISTGNPYADRTHP